MHHIITGIPEDLFQHIGSFLLISPFLSLSCSLCLSRARAHSLFVLSARVFALSRALSRSLSRAFSRALPFYDSYYLSFSLPPSCSVSLPSSLSPSLIQLDFHQILFTRMYSHPSARTHKHTNCHSYNVSEGIEERAVSAWCNRKARRSGRRRGGG